VLPIPRVKPGEQVVRRFAAPVRKHWEIEEQRKG
jgi:hypothetical protein